MPSEIAGEHLAVRSGAASRWRRRRPRARSRRRTGPWAAPWAGTGRGRDRTRRRRASRARPRGAPSRAPTPGRCRPAPRSGTRPGRSRSSRRPRSCRRRSRSGARRASNNGCFAFSAFQRSSRPWQRLRQHQRLVDRAGASGARERRVARVAGDHHLEPEQADLRFDVGGRGGLGDERRSRRGSRARRRRACRCRSPPPRSPTRRRGRLASRTPARRSALTTAAQAMVPDFMSAAPRPYIQPSTISAPNGSRVQRSRGPTGTTSTWPLRISERPPASAAALDADHAQRLVVGDFGRGEPVHALQRLDRDRPAIDREARSRRTRAPSAPAPGARRPSAKGCAPARRSAATCSSKPESTASRMREIVALSSIGAAIVVSGRRQIVSDRDRREDRHDQATNVRIVSSPRSSVSRSLSARRRRRRPRSRRATSSTRRSTSRACTPSTLRLDESRQTRGRDPRQRCCPSSSRWSKSC